MHFTPTGTRHPDALLLIDELNRTLIGILGHDGTRHVNLDDFEQPDSVFMVGYDDGVPVCCAGVRRLDGRSGEVKRVYARKNRKGYAEALMNELGLWAAAHGYERLVLECREQNAHALDFYRRIGYRDCEKYPPYEDEADAICMEKCVS